MFEVVLFYCIGTLFLLVSWIDFKKRIVPNSAVAVLVVFRLGLLGCSILDVGDVRVNLWGSTAFFVSLVVALALCFCMSFVGELISRRTNSMALGFGDVKLVFACTLFCTLEESLTALLVASAVALVLALRYFICKNDKTFPFAPALCIGFGVVFAMKML